MPKATRRITRNTSRSKPLAPLADGKTRSTGTRMRPKPERVSKTVKASSKSREKRELPFAFFDRSEKEVEADPNRRLPLLRLPRELVQDIASYLPLASSICFTLTCKEVLNIVGIESWIEFNMLHRSRSSPRRSADLDDLFTLLLRDWSGLVDFCANCNTLHPQIQPPRSHRKTRLTTCCFGQDAMIDYLPRDASHGYMPVFLHIAEAMKSSEEFASKDKSGPPIDSLSGEFTIAKPNLHWRLSSSGKRINGNLIIQHVHTFQSTTNKRLDASDILSLPVRLCPHQSTTITLPERSRYIKTDPANGPLLTHAITTTFPAARRTTVKSSNSFRKPTSLEQEQMATAEAGEEVMYRCRSCPTKFQVQYSQPDGLIITTWHCFGRDLYHASKYWKWFVRRDGKLLGKDKRNDEWWSPSRSVPDFQCG